MPVLLQSLDAQLQTNHQAIVAQVLAYSPFDQMLSPHDDITNSIVAAHDRQGHPVRQDGL